MRILFPGKTAAKLNPFDITNCIWVTKKVIPNFQDDLFVLLCKDAMHRVSTPFD